jgi:aryl-alcohol dehydrogenase-like predicted oxidoreductase
VDEFYLHQPDTSARLEATLEACHGLATQGLIGRLGMSNYHAIEVGDSVKKHEG